MSTRKKVLLARSKGKLKWHLVPTDVGLAEISMEFFSDFEILQLGMHEIFHYIEFDRGNRFLIFSMSKISINYHTSAINILR